MLKWYGYLGLALIALAQINFYTAVQPFARWYIVIVWYGYILFVDSVVHKVKGSSIISKYPKELLAMAAISVPFWLIFEFYNLFTHSWYYVNYLWYVHLLDFTTILPAVLETFSLLHALNIGTMLDHKPKRRRGASHGASIAVRFLVFIGFGAAISPLVLGPPGFLLMWIGLPLFLDPLNYISGKPSLLQKASIGRRSVMLQVFIAGLIMGFMWEFWNFQAYAQWHYTLPYPIIGSIRLFAMPLEGYFGYLPFGAAAFLFYAFFRSHIFRHANNAIDMH